MKEYLLLFRADISNIPAMTPEEAQVSTRRWMDWIKGIDAKNRLSDRGNRLASSGKVLKSDKIVTNGPYTEIKETIGGYTLIRAGSYDEAVDLASDCPILMNGGNVEIREISPL